MYTYDTQIRGQSTFMANNGKQKEDDSPPIKGACYCYEGQG